MKQFSLVVGPFRTWRDGEGKLRREAKAIKIMAARNRHDKQFYDDMDNIRCIHTPCTTYQHAA